MGRCSTKSKLRLIHRAPSRESHFVQHEVENDRCRIVIFLFLRRESTHRAPGNAPCSFTKVKPTACIYINVLFFHHCFLVSLKDKKFRQECFLFRKLYLPFQIKYKFSSFELHNQFWVEWNVKTSLFFFPHLFVSIFIFRHNAKICGSGRTWSSRSCQNQYGPGRGTALKAWVICSTCPRSTLKTGPQRWALN